MTASNNDHYKRIRTALGLSNTEVADVLCLGGREITKSRADGWGRGEHDKRRFVRMTDDDFDAFTHGLVAWCRQNVRQDEEA
ncbi:DUF1456 family protein [Roseivivax marinus]|uniref:DUF1456 family protein n=1 Tax=Roseivivax marinus TaxID=1379903 RepID=UPI00273D8943|nr:DUF1456 family protein [Roseivivax marinus]